MFAFHLEEEIATKMVDVIFPVQGFVRNAVNDPLRMDLHIPAPFGDKKRFCLANVTRIDFEFRM